MKKGAGNKKDSLMNDVIWHSFLKAKVQDHKEPTALFVLIVEDQAITHKHSDGASNTP